MAETKTKAKVKEEPTIDEQIKLLDVPKAVDVVLKDPVTDEERTYVQHELGFLPKLKLFRLLSGTIRLATENDSGGAEQFVNEALGSTAGQISSEGFIEMMMKLVELAPDFIDEAYLLILKVPLEEQEWARKALDELDDEQGLKIIDTFIAQNGQSLRDFFTKRLASLQKRATTEFGDLVTGQESETTT